MNDAASKKAKRTTVDDVVDIARAALADPDKRARLMEQDRMYRHLLVLQATPGNEIYDEHKRRISWLKVKDLEAKLASAKAEMEGLAK